MSKFLFLVSSAIHTSYSVFDVETRIKQTKDTIESIKKYCQNCDISIIDGGEKNLTSMEINNHFDKINDFYNVSSDSYVMRMHKATPNSYKRIYYNIDIRNIIKNSIEIYMFLKYFKKIRDENYQQNYSRIFKLSGRYRLNDSFNLDKHINSTNKIVILKPKNSEFRSEVTHGIRKMYMSRLWSFDTSLLSEIIDSYENVLKNMEHVYSSGGYVDIEHSLYKFLNEEMISFVDVIGVDGDIAPTGKNVSE